MSIKTIFHIAVVAVLYSLLTACHSAPETATAETPKTNNIESNTTLQLTDAQYDNANISTTQLQQKMVSENLHVNGKIDVPPQNLVSISVPMGGYIKTTHLLPGLHVKKGEVLAVIEDQQYIDIQQDYLMCQSKLHFANLEYRRQKELNDSQAGSSKAVQQAETVMREQSILLAGLTEKLRLININSATLNENNISKSITIHSPIDGFVSTVNVNIGKYVNPADILFELVNPADIHLNLRVFEKDLENLSIGQNIIAYTNTKPNKKYRGNIILISKDVATDGSTEVHCHFDTYDKSLTPGMYMNAEIVTNNRSISVLPETAVVGFEGKQYVFLQTGKQQYKIQTIEIGQISNGLVEIMQPNLLQQQPIVEKGAYALLMKVMNTEEE